MQVTIATGKTPTRQKAPVESAKKRKPTRQTRQRAKEKKALAKRQELVEKFFVARDMGFSDDYKAFARLDFLRQMVAKGVFTDFPGQLQTDGMTNLHNYAWVAPAKSEA